MDVIIVTPYVSQLHHVPAGMVYVDEMLVEAQLGEDQSELTGSEWLEQCLQQLKRRFRRRVRVRLLDPMTLNGLFFVIRHRIRHFPTVVMENGLVLVQPTVETVVSTVEEISKTSF